MKLGGGAYPVLAGALIGASLLLFTSACTSDPSRGYSFTPARSDETRTITVPVFQNTSFSHGLEIHLTEAIVKEIQRSTPWRVVADRSAQTILAGVITSAALRPLSTSSATGMVLEQGVEVSVDFEWKNSASGEVLIARRGFKTLQSFVPARGTGERVELGEHAAVQELARAIVNELRSGW